MWPLMGMEQKIAQALLDIGAVKVSVHPAFTWTSGIISPIYCDNRKLISHPAVRKLIVNGFADMVRALPLPPEFIGGTATAAIPWAAFLAYELGLPMVYIRPEKKEHGAGRQVEGDLPPDKRVLIVEDLISTGGSSLAAAQAVSEECSGVVTDVLAIVTYELEESKQKFEAANLHLSTLTTFSHIMDVAMQRKLITSGELKKILEFKKNPRAWHA